MKLWWQGNGRRQLEAEAECERLRAHLDALQSHVLALAAHEDAPAELLAAMREPSRTGEVVRLHAAGREVIAVIGEEAADARLLWHEITAAASEAEPTHADVRVEPREMVTGLRALAVRAGDGLTIWSPKDLPPLLRKGAARKVVAAAHGRRARIAGLLPLPVGIPALRHLIAGAAIAGVVTAGVLLVPSPYLGLRFPGSAGDGAQVGPAASRQAARGRSGGGAAAAPAGQAQRAPAAGASPGPVPSPSPQTSSAPSGPLPPLPSASVKASVGVSPPVPLPSVSASACVTLLTINPCVSLNG